VTRDTGAHVFEDCFDILAVSTATLRDALSPGLEVEFNMAAAAAFEQLPYLTGTSPRLRYFLQQIIAIVMLTLYVETLSLSLGEKPVLVETCHYLVGHTPNK